MRRFILSIVGGLALATVYAGASYADAQADCSSDDNARRISGCSEIIDAPGTKPAARAKAYAMRALAFSMNGRYALSVPDYDAALRLNPGFAVAWNNRAWSLFKSGQAARGLPDVERSLQLSPLSPHSYDTRAHIYQFTGRPDKAMRDYNRAIRLGGKHMTRLYQCGLQERGLYKGLLDGINTPQLHRALKTCVQLPKCDPLPDDENCRQATS